jgi:integrase
LLYLGFSGYVISLFANGANEIASRASHTLPTFGKQPGDEGLMRLTQKAVAALALPAGKSELIVFDDDIPLGVRMRDGGTARWIFQYRVGAKQRRMSLGTTAALSAPRAREIAAELYAKVKLGEDPAATKAEERVRAVETMGATLEAYLAHQRARLKPRSLVEVERHLRKHCRPLHGLRLDKIDRRAVAACITTIAAKSGGVTANRVATSLSAFFSWSMRAGLTGDNPASQVNRQPERTRSRVLNNAELRAIWAATADASDYGAVVRLLMLSGQRASEIAGLKWSEISGNQILLPAERTKNGRAHAIPISEPMRVILEGRPRREGRDYLFGRRWNSPLAGWSVLKAGLDRRLGSAVTDWTHHDLRRSCATHMAEIGIPPHVIEAVLNHVSGHKAGVAGIYNRADYEPQKRHALTAWGEHLLKIVEGRPAPKRVVPLRA